MNESAERLQRDTRKYIGGTCTYVRDEGTELEVMSKATIQDILVTADQHELVISYSNFPAGVKFRLDGFGSPLVHTSIGEGVGLVVLPGHGFLNLTTPERDQAHRQAMVLAGKPSR